mmetsp:Transcript_3413/g.6314  ORF Transcript_3413/g.6314 Transcript_3413/m.6314 type:complete len:95 (-) Transcript_3413:219-503(-)
MGKHFTCEQFIQIPGICNITVPEDTNSQTFGYYCCETCNTEYDCGDVKKFRMKPKTNRKGCKWVRKKKNKRCKKNFKGLRLSDYCGATCDTCTL